MVVVLKPGTLQKDIDQLVAKLQEMGYEFETDHPVDANHTCIRLVTSWATPETAVEDFLRDLAGC